MEHELVISPVKLTIGMLVSNRKQFIREVMEGIKPLLEMIPSELIVVDTKGADGDGSIEIVKEYTDKIYPFTWCNDFSKARNVVFEHAQGEWFLVLDDDEVLDNIDELIQFFNGEECNRYNCGRFIGRNYNAEGEFTVNTTVRCYRRSKGTRYVGAIHEKINDMRPPMKEFSCVIHHYGYAFKNLEEAQKHQQRNVSILKGVLETSGYTPRLCAQMTQELIYLETSTDEGFEFAQKSLNIFQEANQLQNPASQYIMYATVLYYLRKNEPEKAIAQIDFLQKNYPLLEITQLTFTGICAELALEKKDINGMLQYALNYIELWDWKQKQEEEAARQIVFRFPQYCENSYYYRIVHIGAAAANELECYAAAKSLWNRMPWKTEGFDATPYHQDLSNTLQGLKRVQELQKQYAGICGQLDVLEQAAAEAETLKQAGQRATAQEYREAMKQLMAVLYNTLQRLLHENSQSLNMLNGILEKCAREEIGQLKTTVQNECRELLERNL